MGSLPTGRPTFILLDGEGGRPRRWSASGAGRVGVAARVAFVREALFPATETRRPLKPAVVVVGYVLAAVAGFAVDLWWSGSGITSRVWAEDGAVFLSTAYRLHYFTAVATPYAGYLQVVPRSFAALASVFPASDAAWVLAASAAAGRAAVSLFVFRASSGHLRSTSVRAMLAAAVVLLPVGGYEVLDNIANLHWYFTFAAFWAVLWRPSRQWECALAATVVVVAVGSDPLTALLLPIVVLRAISIRGWRDQVVTMSFAAAGAVQMWAVLSGTRPTHETFSVLTVTKLFSVRILLGALTGYWHTVALWRHLHYVAVGFAAIAVLASITPALRTGGSRRWLAIWAGAGSVLAFFACFAEPAVVPHLKLDRGHLPDSLRRAGVAPDAHRDRRRPRRAALAGQPNSPRRHRRRVPVGLARRPRRVSAAMGTPGEDRPELAHRDCQRPTRVPRPSGRGVPQRRGVGVGVARGLAGSTSVRSDRSLTVLLHRRGLAFSLADQAGFDPFR